MSAAACVLVSAAAFIIHSSLAGTSKICASERWCMPAPGLQHSAAACAVPKQSRARTLHLPGRPPTKRSHALQASRPVGRIVLADIVPEPAPTTTECFMPALLPPACRPAGAVVRADIMTGDDGRSKGYGIVAFGTPSDAQAALEVRGGRACRRQRWVGRYVGARHVDAKAAIHATDCCADELLCFCRISSCLQLLNGMELEGRRVTAKFDRFA